MKELPRYDPARFRWKGRPVSELPREQLEQVVCELVDKYFDTITNLQRTNALRASKQQASVIRQRNHPILEWLREK